MNTLNDITNERITQNGVHIIDGIAGAAKTSRAVAVLAGIEYLHTTSTNRLRRDIEKRFNHPAATVASALFTTRDGHFYDAEKTPDYSVIIIDEILQTSPKIFDWIEHNKETKSIIICTDSKQTLTPGGGAECLKRFNALKTVSDAITLTKSYRPVNNVSRETYINAYAADSNGHELFQTLYKRAPHTRISDIEYKQDDAYITHTNESEKQIYDCYDIRNNYDIPLIAKGTLSTRDNVRTKDKYPIMPQADAENKKALGYWQAANIGTVVRFQGSEVQQGRKCYYIVPPHAEISNRECYTLITRCRDVNDIVIVELPPERDAAPLVYFNGCPVLDRKDYIIRNGDKLQDGVDAMTAEIGQREIAQILRKANNDNDSVYYDRVRRKGRIISPYAGTAKTNKVTLYSLLKKEPELALQKPNLFYREIDTLRTGAREIYTPVNMDYELTNGNPIDRYKYGIDLYAAYPHCWKIGGVPDGRTYRNDDAGEVKIYVTINDIYGHRGTVITEPYYKVMQAAPGFTAACVGSIDMLKTDKIGAYLYAQAYRSIESKQALKSVHYGYLQKRYIEMVKTNHDGTPRAYAIDTKNVYELVMIFIQSELSRVIAEIKKAVYGNVYRGRTLVDCLYFDTDDDIIETGNRIKTAIPGYDFRIFENTGEGATSTKPILYQTYAPLETETERKKRLDKERKRKEREEK